MAEKCVVSHRKSNPSEDRLASSNPEVARRPNRPIVLVAKEGIISKRPRAFYPRRSKTRRNGNNIKSWDVYWFVVVDMT